MTEQDILSAKRSYLELRCRVLQTMRSFFLDEGFLEVQTPLLTNAPAPEPHIEAVQAEGGRFLITSPELYMKRLLAAGYEKIFQITPVFRGEEYGRFHHPEFTLLEWYRLNANYKSLQQDCQSLLQTICDSLNRSSGWTYQGHRLEVSGRWQTCTVKEAFERFAGWEPQIGADADRFDRDMVEKVEPHLGFPSPCILTDYPADQAALARLKPEDPSVAERFELYWAGRELANGFSELTDAREQRDRFEAVLEMRKQLGRAPYPLPEKFLQSLPHLQPCAGIALGVDRLVMLLADADRLDEVVAFPPDLV
jgi:elongation factor P--(R)-beta-lysine ligase